MSWRWIAVTLIAIGTGCGSSGDGSTEGGSETSTIVADTQLVVDPNSGAQLMIVKRRMSDVREVHPRKGAGDPDAPDAYRYLKPEMAQTLMQAAEPPWYILDVRGATEYATEGRIPGAVLVPFEELEENIEDLHVRTDQMILVYSYESRRGTTAARLLAEYGFLNVRILEGGFRTWALADLPVETGL